MEELAHPLAWDHQAVLSGKVSKVAQLALLLESCDGHAGTYGV